MSTYLHALFASIRVIVHWLCMESTRAFGANAALGPIITGLLKDILHLVNTSLLDIINVSVLSGHVPLSFIVLHLVST